MNGNCAVVMEGRVLMLTLFSCPKPFHGHTDVIQRNAIKSWTLLQPRPEIILLGDDAGVAEICQEFGLTHVPDVEKNEYGTPLVSSIFWIGQDAADFPVVCYVNADIILMSDFLKAVGHLADFPSRFLVVGQRWDVDLGGVWDFASSDWESALRNLVMQKGELHGVCGIDYFLFPRGMYSDIPPFAIGRFGWDNWLVYQARAMGAPVVDATAAVMAIHQNHDYLPQQLKRGPGGERLTGPEVSGNRALTNGMICAFTVQDATWVLDQKGLRRPSLTYLHLKRRLMAFMRLRPALRRFYRLALRVRLSMSVRSHTL